MAIYGIDRFRKFFSNLPRPWKRSILVAFDLVALSFAAWAAYSLRTSGPPPVTMTHAVMIVSAAVVAIPVFVRFGLYRSVIRYLPERALWTIAKAVTVATLIWVCVLFVAEISRVTVVPRSLPIIYYALAVFIIGGSRFAAKYLLWAPMRRQYAGQVVIYGAGAAGAQLLAALRQYNNKYVVGFLDDDKSLHGRDVAGVRVYSPAQLPHLMETTGVSEVIISVPSVDGGRRQQIFADLSRHKVKIRTLPAIADLASGRYLVSQIREIDIDDILGRSTVPADPDLLRQMIEGRAILVSGAGGSIGSELCRLIVKWNPRTLVLLEANEYALYQIERSLRVTSQAQIIPVLGSVTDGALVRRTLRTHGIQVVFHTAAHKHVPLVELNVFEGVRNNVFGTQTIAEAALDAGVENFVLISTDKAVHPTNVMGATKRWAELIIQECAVRSRSANNGQRFCAVRFGNVLGSNGSVVPLFKEQIASGGPVTLTDVEMTRYFMSIHEAAELIVQAGALSEGGDTFVLEMGEPVRIGDLATNMIRLAGLSIRNKDNPDGDIAISVVGRRPGEKVHEELFYSSDTVKPTAQAKIMRASREPVQDSSMIARLEELSQAITAEDEVAVRRLLFGMIQSRTTTTGSQVLPFRASGSS